MPAFELPPGDVEGLAAWLGWTAAHRAELVAANDERLGREPFSWRRLPWFEYR